MADPIINKRTVTEERAGWIFGQIADLAATVERFGVLAVANDAGEDHDPRDLAAYLEGVKSLSAQIGLLADFGSKLTGGIVREGSGVADWLLPPVYPRSESETRHG